MTLTGKSDYCTSFCEQNHTGEIIQHHYDKPTHIDAKVKVEPIKETMKFAAVKIKEKQDEFEVITPTWISFDKYKSKAPESFHERLMSILGLTDFENQ